MHKLVIVAIILLIIMINITRIEGFKLSEFGSLFDSDVPEEDDDCTE
jgi:hypothetical protein